MLHAMVSSCQFVDSSFTTAVQWWEWCSVFSNVPGCKYTHLEMEREVIGSED